MKLLQLKCPTCGAKLEVSDQLKSFTCNYCGQVTMLDDEIIKVEHKIIGNDKNEAFQRVEGFFKLKYYDQALKLSFELTDKYPYDAQAWLYLIKAYTQDFDAQPDSEDFLNNLAEYFKNYSVFEQEDTNLKKIKKKYDEYVSKYKDMEFWGKVIIHAGSADGLLCKFEIFIDDLKVTKISQSSGVEMEVVAGAHVLQIKSTGSFSKSGKYSFYLNANKSLSFDISQNGSRYSVTLDGEELKVNKEDDNSFKNLVKSTNENQELKCPSCYEKIQYGDSKCKHCGGKLYWPEEK